ncbi:putative sushi, von Willebrand factor type A [Apostichopus japonicus]|uniref:Putative sushi, von Willebrand factor type A n=1 Tax=Stichopus japonicus TaxID=307972 RepID=A0A2G8LMT0_STIJA|nr:putative sushi, von Willebrand factor type A [Apostichopus japonicus]
MTAVHSSYTLVPESDCYADQENATATCRGVSAQVVDIQCLDGTWSEDLNISCGCLTSSFDADVTINPSCDVIDFDVMVNFTCSNGFNQSGPTSATCTTQGVWDPVDLPKCIAKCETFEIDNGVGPTAVAYESNTTTVSCNEGFTFGGDGYTTTEVITCLDIGLWNNEPTCSAGSLEN